ncbi:MAG: class I SAM-dependent methyltransferase [Pyrinomonadaceae bacterium]
MASMRAAFANRRAFTSYVRYAARRAAGYVAGQFCSGCGVMGRLLDSRLEWIELVEQWELSPEWAARFYAREGHACEWCGASLRSQQLAGAVVSVANAEWGTSANSLNKLCDDPRFRALSVAEINSAGNLHQFLSKLPNLKYSEFGGDVPGVPSESLEQLSYGDSSFDIVLTSDTLEHVPDVDTALGEIRRVLKPGGYHIFTVPVLMDRPATRRRASMSGGELVHHLPPSYHGMPGDGRADLIVFNEFGADFAATCERAGFDVRLDRSVRNQALVVFIARRAG